MSAEVTIERDGHLGFVTMRRPPNNFLDADLVEGVADAYESLQGAGDCRAIVLRSEGKHFCAGARLHSSAALPRADLFDQAARVMSGVLPVVACVQGAAIGGGLGLALTADFRVASTASRWSTAFARLGSSPGFGLTVTLPAVVGRQHAARLLMSAARIDGAEAARLGLCDRVVEPERLESTAVELAAELAAAAPIAVRSIRETLRRDLVTAFEHALVTEAADQRRTQRSDDYREGIAASADRREPRFTGR